MNVRERREAAARREAHELIDEFGVEQTSIALDVHLITVKRWRSGAIVCPTPVLIALRWLTGRHTASPDWEGWAIRDNFLYAPTGERFIPGDLLGRRYQIQLQKHYEAQIRALRTKLNQIQDGAANDALDGMIMPQTEETLAYTIGRARRKG